MDIKSSLSTAPWTQLSVDVSYTPLSVMPLGQTLKQIGHQRLAHKLVDFVLNTIFPLRLRTWAHFEFHLFSFPSGIGPSNEGIWIVLRSIQHFPCSVRALGVSWGAHEDENTHRNHELSQRLCGTSYFTSSPQPTPFPYFRLIFQ